MYSVSSSGKDWIAEVSWPSNFKPGSFLKKKKKHYFQIHLGNSWIGATNLNGTKKQRSNNLVILELEQRIPSQSLPQGSKPTQFNGLFFQDCMRDDRAVTAASTISIRKLNS